MKPVTGWLSYPVALVLGLAFAAWLFPLSSVWPAAPLHVALVGDEAVFAVGQRYFLAEGWDWPLLQAHRLAAPGGTNIAMTDSIPLAMLAAKLVRAWLPAGFFLTTGWVAFAWSLQPAAAVYALRGAGERRWLPALAVAVLSVSMPTLLGRYGHMALCTHAAILTALGLYLRLVSGPCSWSWVAAALLLPVCLLIHPYILAIVVAVFAAVPLSLLLGGDRRWRVAVPWFAGSIALVWALALLLGYGGNQPQPGLGFYSMNLLAPLLPSHSAFFPDETIDATGGQGLEGFQYLGAGLLLLLLLVAVPAFKGSARLDWRRHAGLAAALLALTAVSLSNRVYAGHWLVLELHKVPIALLQFRSTGRFFWPVAYAAMIAAVLLAARAFPPRRAAALLVVAAGLQFVEAGAQRGQIHLAALNGTPWVLDEPLLAPVFAAHHSLTLWPVFGCGVDDTDPLAMQALLLASQTVMPTNTMFSARTKTDPDCDAAAMLSPPLRPGELRVIHRPNLAWLVPDAARACRRLARLVLCSADPLPLPTAAPLEASPLPLGESPQPAIQDVLGAGWSLPQPAGIWSDGALATLVFHRPAAGRLMLTLQGVGFAAVPGGSQTIKVVVDGTPMTAWQAPDMAAGRFQVDLPPGGPDPTVVDFHITQPARPVDRGMNDDTRDLGLLLQSLRLDPAN